MDPMQLILIGGAAGAFYLVLKMLVDGKLHTDSEVQGLKGDKKLLSDENKELAEALRLSNALLQSYIESRKP